LAHPTRRYDGEGTEPPGCSSQASPQQTPRNRSQHIPVHR
jgi:hypothetical protein